MGELPTALFALKVSRPYFYLVTLWLYVLPTGRHFDLLTSGWFWCAAAHSNRPSLPSMQLHIASTRIRLGVRTSATAFRVRCGLLYCTLPLNLLCYLMNDLADTAVRLHRTRIPTHTRSPSTSLCAARRSATTATLRRAPSPPYPPSPPHPPLSPATLDRRAYGCPSHSCVFPPMRFLTDAFSHRCVCVRAG